MSMSESVTEFSEVLPPSTSLSVRVGVGSGGGSGIQASPKSYLVFPLSLNVAWKASGQHFAGSGPIGLSWELLLLLQSVWYVIHVWCLNVNTYTWLYNSTLPKILSTNKNAKIVMSNFHSNWYQPVPLSCICSSFSPPCFTVTEICVLLASKLEIRITVKCKYST